MGEEKCSPCEEFLKALEEVEKEEMAEGESAREEKKKREPLCITLPPEMCREIAEMSETLSIDKSKIIELALTPGGSEVISMLRKATKAVKAIEERHKAEGEVWAESEAEEGGEKE